MSLYLFVTILISVFSFLIYEGNELVQTTKKTKSIDNACFAFSFAILLIMLMLCDDRSPDYRAYKSYYNLAPSTLDFSSSYYSSIVHTEFGWKLLMNLFKKMCFSFEWFIAIVCGFSFLLLCKYINRFCKSNKTLSLFWLYGSFCLVYYYIGIRMGLSISIFLGLLLPALEDKKNLKYVLGVLICTGIHKVSILYLLLIFIKKMNLSNLRKYLTICVVVGIGLMITGTSGMMYRLIPTAVVTSLGYGRNVSENLPIFQLIYRLVFLTLTLYCYYVDGKMRNEYENFYKYYFSGTMFYLFFAGIPIIGTRVLDMVKPLEIIFICQMIGEEKRRDLLGRTLFFVCFVLCFFMVFYHINAIKNYFPETSDYSIYTFPFKSIIS